MYDSQQFMFSHLSFLNQLSILGIKTITLTILTNTVQVLSLHHKYRMKEYDMIEEELYMR